MADVKALEYSTMKVGLYLVYLRIGVVEFKRELGHTSHIAHIAKCRLFQQCRT